MRKTYQATLDYLYAQLPMYQRVGPVAFKKDLGNIRRLVKALGNPHLRFPSIHIAGTNGKGSTAHILASVFQAAGLKTGLYTSPHYCDFRERIKIDGQLIPERKIIDFVNHHQNLLEEIQPSFFEITVAMAFQYFAQEEVEVAVVETGLGGRLDSTNILHPLLSIITNISYDHQAMLGDTLELIAGEKAGIIKEGVPVIIGETQKDSRKVFDVQAKKKKAPIYYADQEYRLEKKSSLAFHTLYEVFRQEKLYLANLKVNLTADYQSANLATALKALEIISEKRLLGLEIGEKPVRNGLEYIKQLTLLMGRWQKIGEHPLIICDSAHNEAGLRRVFEQIRSIKFKTLHFVLGTVNDKSLETILPLFPKEAVYYFCKADIPRGLPADKLKAEAGAMGLKGQAYSSVLNAFQAAQRIALPEDLIFIGGSIFIVGEVLQNSSK